MRIIICLMICVSAWISTNSNTKAFATDLGVIGQADDDIKQPVEITDSWLKKQNMESNSMKKKYQHLGVFSNLVAATNRSHKLFPIARPGKKTQQRVFESLAFSPGPEVVREVKIEHCWKKDGIEGEQLSWWVGYGPRTKAWLLKPAGSKERLPGILALHDHGAFKFYGKEKIADGWEKTPKVLIDFRKRHYGERAFANELAREGFVVLVHDAFLWGSRKFPMETIPDADRQCGKAFSGENFLNPTSAKVERYNSTTKFHEHTITKYLTILGTTLAGVISYEDRVAVNYLLSCRKLCNGRIGCIGLSGGGLRSTLLHATSDHIRAAVVVGLMSTSKELLDHNIISHTWMFFPPGWGRYGDWTDLAACRAPSPILVQYDLEDELFTPEGMKAADRRLSMHYRSVGAPTRYRGEFYPGPHKFDIPMQKSAFAWLKHWL